MGAPKLYTDEELRAHKNARTAARYRENKEKINAYHAALHASRKNDPEYMRKQREKSAAYRAANPEKIKELNAKRRREKPEETKKYQREWFSKNRDKAAVYQQNRRKRALANGCKLSVDIRSKLMKLQRGLCACCRESLTVKKPTLDHIFPLALGGSHTDDNVQLLCQQCNSQKYAKHPVDFMQEKGFLL